MVYKMISSGGQKKAWIDGRLIKIDSIYNEAIHEYVCSTIFRIAGYNSVEYRLLCKDVYGVRACECDSYLLSGESSIPIEGFIRFSYDKNTSAYSLYRNTINSIISNTGIDRYSLEEHILTYLALDFIVMNPDRHLTNIEIIVDGNGRYRVSPYFDFGMEFTGLEKYGYNIGVASNKFKSQPFSSNPIKNLIDIGFAKRVGIQIQSTLESLIRYNIPSVYIDAVAHQISKLLAL